MIKRREGERRQHNRGVPDRRTGGFHERAQDTVVVDQPDSPNKARSDTDRRTEPSDPDIGGGIVDDLKRRTRIAAESARPGDHLAEAIANAPSSPEPGELWSGSWNNWLAPFSLCPRCEQSLNWKRGEDALERPLIDAACCGVHFVAMLTWEGS